MVFIFFCVGIALGTYIVKYMRASDASDLTSYFSTFAQSIVKEPVNNKVLLLNVLKKNLILLTVLITISFTVFGTPIILLLDLIKGFTLGYTFSFLISTFEGKGLWLALVATIPQNIIYIPSTTFIYFFKFPFGSINSKILTIITAIAICSIQLLKKFIIYTSSHYLKFLQQELFL